MKILPRLVLTAVVSSVTTLLVAEAACVNGVTSSSDPNVCSSCNDDTQWGGPSCDLPCVCGGPGLCGVSSTDGSCISCRDRAYGPNCTLTCSCFMGTCRRTTSLDGGTCASCFNEFLEGENCNSCPSNRGGATCLILCPDCGSNGRCDSGIGNSGKCICNDGWFGSLCNRNELTATKEMTVTPPLPPPTPEPPQGPTDGSGSTTDSADDSGSGNSSLVTPNPSSSTDVPATTLGEVIVSLRLLFTRPVILTEVKDIVLRETGFPSSDVNLAHLGGSDFVSITMNTQAQFYAFAARLDSGNTGLGSLGLSRVQKQYYQPTQAPAAGPGPTAAATPSPRVETPEKESISPVAIGFISLAILGVVVGIIAVLIYRWVKKEKKKIAIENDKAKSRRAQYSSGGSGGDNEDEDAKKTGTFQRGAVTIQVEDNKQHAAPRPPTPPGQKHATKKAAPGPVNGGGLMADEEEMSGFSGLPEDKGGLTGTGPSSPSLGNSRDKNNGSLGTSGDGSTGGRQLKRKGPSGSETQKAHQSPSSSPQKEVPAATPSPGGSAQKKRPPLISPSAETEAYSSPQQLNDKGGSTTGKSLAQQLGEEAIPAEQDHGGAGAGDYSDPGDDAGGLGDDGVEFQLDDFGSGGAQQ